jgi:hypothetical protein
MATAVLYHRKGTHSMTLRKSTTVRRLGLTVGVCGGHCIYRQGFIEAANRNAKYREEIQKLKDQLAEEKVTSDLLSATVHDTYDALVRARGRSDSFEQSTADLMVQNRHLGYLCNSQGICCKI